MAKTETIETIETAARKVPVIPTANAVWESLGNKYGHLVVELPPGVIPQDLQDHPEIWSLIQGRGISLTHEGFTTPRGLARRFEVSAFAHDGSWAIQRAMVIDATTKDAKLNFRGIVNFEPQADTWEDSAVIIKFDGAGFRIFDKHSNAPGREVYTSLDQAKAAYFRGQSVKIA